MKALVGAFNQEKALVGAFSVIVKTDCETGRIVFQHYLSVKHQATCISPEQGYHREHAPKTASDWNMKTFYLTIFYFSSVSIYSYSNLKLK